MRRTVAVLTMSMVVSASGCVLNQTMWTRCDPNGDPFGLDGVGPNALVLYCDNGEWVPKLTAQEYVDLRVGKPVTIAPVPTRPTTTVPVTAPAVPAPTITGLFLGGGPANSADDFYNYIEGTNLAATTDVTVGGQSVRFEIAKDWHREALSIVMPVRGVGPVDITVTNAGGSATLTQGYTYYPAPTITSSSFDAVNRLMTVTGTNFDVPYFVTSGAPPIDHPQIELQVMDASDTALDTYRIASSEAAATTMRFPVAAYPQNASYLQWRLVSLGGVTPYQRTNL